MIMTEAERQYYLGKAGIHLWYARAPLPGAAPSPEFRFPVDDDERAPEPESDAVTPRAMQPSMPRTNNEGPAKERLAGLQALMAKAEPQSPKAESHKEAGRAPDPVTTRDVDPPASVANEPPAEETAPAVDAPSDIDLKAQINASLGIWIAEHLVLVSSISDEASERLQENLAGNILGSLGESGVERSRHIRWPVFGNPRVPGNGVDGLRQVLRSVSQEFGARKLVFLGVLADDMPSGRSDWLCSALGAPAVDFPRSLAELAAVPSYKRELWQQLKSAFGV